MPSWPSVRRNLYRIRLMAMPPSPKTVAEILAAYENKDILDAYGSTINAGDLPSTVFYRKLHSETQFAYCIFASQAIVDRINELPKDRRHFFMDATFRVVPYGEFNQLLVIHVSFLEKVCIK